MKNNILLMILIIYVLACPHLAIGQGSLYQDNRARQVGDIITVVLMENISGSSTTDARTSSRTDGGTSGGMESNFISFQPYFGSNSSVNYNADDKATANQRQLLQGSVSVVVEEVLANGNLIINGERYTEINGEMHKIRVKGVIRPIDVDNHNRIPSFRVANAEIDYQKKDGFKQSRRRPGFLRRALWAGLGLAMTAVVVMREVQ